VTERIDARNLGLGTALGSRWSPVDGLALFLGAGVAAVHTKASLGANDCFDLDPLTSGCQTAAPFFSTRRATDESFGVRGALQAGAGYDFGVGQVSLDGSLRYTSNEAGVANPSAFGDRSGITFRGEPGFTLGLRVVVPIDNVY